MAEITIPEHLRYTEDHEWVEVEDEIATVGITDYAQSELGDIVYVELPELGTRLDQGKAFGLVEAVKTVADLYAPVTGEVIDVNPLLTESPELINSSAYEDGWIIRIRAENPWELEGLLEAVAYADHVGA